MKRKIICAGIFADMWTELMRILMLSKIRYPRNAKELLKHKVMIMDTLISILEGFRARCQKELDPFNKTKA